MTENVQRRIKAILALADRPGTEGEALAAMDRAKAVLGSYGMTAEEFRAAYGTADNPAKRPVNVAVHEVFRMEAKRREHWLYGVFRAACFVAGCRPFYWTSKSECLPSGRIATWTVFVGLGEADTCQAAGAIAHFLAAYATRAAGDASVPDHWPVGEKRVWRNNFLLGFGERVTERAKRMERESRLLATREERRAIEAGEEPGALLIVASVAREVAVVEAIEAGKSAFAKKHGIRSGGGSSARYHNSGREAGRGAGDRAPLSKRGALA